VAKEVQRNAKWGLLCGKREGARWKRRESEMREESGRDGKGKWVGWKINVGEMEKERGLDRKRKYHPSLCARVIL
jgi:hypothetical protein